MLRELTSEFAAHLQGEKGIAPATQRGYLGAVTSLLAVCGAYPQRLHLPAAWGAADIDKRALEIYFDHLREERGLKTTTLALHAAALRAFFDFLQGRGHIGRNPARNLLPKLPPRTESAPAGEEDAVREMFAAEGTGVDAARRLLLLELGYGAGLRPTQIYAVRSLRVARRQHLLRIQSGDGALERVLSADGLARAEDYLAARRALLGGKRRAPFWLDGRGRACPPQRLAREIANAMERVGLPRRPSLLRQLAARHFAERGGDTRSVQQLLGARSLGSLDRYAPPDFQAVLRQFRAAHPRQEREP